MLTTRGFWFFAVTFALLATALVLGATPLTLICLTVLFWFLAHWFVFQLRVCMCMRRWSLERTLRTPRGEVQSVWARQKVEVAVTLSCHSALGLPYVVMTDRLPPLASLHDGVLCLDGALSASLSMTYTLETKASGWLRFDGVKVQLADLQGFFTHATFVHDRRDYRVLPTLAVETSHSAYVKHHNVLPLLGAHRHTRPGGSSELLDLRDYIPGDPPRMIAWKVSARRDRLITREFESEVPIRCTLFLDTSNSVRVGPVGETALCRLVEIAAGVAQSNTSQRDLTGLCLFDETGVQHTLRSGRGPKHLLKLLGLLTDVAGLIPYGQHATVRELVPVAYGLAQDLYPDWLDRDVNDFPLWLPFWAPPPRWSMPADLPRYAWRFSPAYQREYRWRKQMSAIMAVRYQLGAGGLAMLLEDDERCVHYLQRFLAEHQVAYPFPLFDSQGRYVFAAPEKAQVLANALLTAITRGRDNELFVLCVDLLDAIDQLKPLERALCVARARHHQVVVVCPWPSDVPTPGARVRAPMDFDLAQSLKQICTEQMHHAFARVQRAFGRVGVPAICAAQGDTVSWILHCMRRLRIQERGVR